MARPTLLSRLERKTKPEMALNRRRSLARILECPICMETYQKPKVFPSCQHSFCLQCMHKIYMEELANGIRSTIYCPICKIPFYLENAEKRPLVHPLTVEALNDMIPNNLTLIAMIDWRSQSAVRNRRKSMVPQSPRRSDSEIIRRDKLPELQVEESESADFPSPGSSNPTPRNRSPSPFEIRASWENCQCCASHATWVCITCDDKMCDLCLGKHLETDGQHQTFNLDEQKNNFDTVAKHRERGRVRRRSKHYLSLSYLSSKFPLFRRRSDPGDVSPTHPHSPSRSVQDSSVEDLSHPLQCPDCMCRSNEWRKGMIDRSADALSANSADNLRSDES